MVKWINLIFTSILIKVLPDYCFSENLSTEIITFTDIKIIQKTYIYIIFAFGYKKKMNRIR